MIKLRRQEEIRLFKEIKSNSRHAESARYKVIYSCEDMIQNIAHKFYKVNLGDDDLKQAGMIGVNNAIDKFDFKRGVRFSSYAYPFVKDAIKREIQKNDSIIHIPIHKQENISIVNKINQQLGGHATAEEISKCCKFSVKEIEALNNLSNLSYFSTYHKENSEIEDYLSDKKYEDIDNRLYLDEVWRISQDFSDEERNIMELRYINELSYTQIGDKLNISREKARQIDNKLLKKYRMLLSND